MTSRNYGSGAAKRRDFFAEVTDKIMRSLEQGCAPWIRPWSEHPGNREVPISAHGRQYRGINRVLLGMEQSMNGYTTPQWFTRKMANDAGGHIRKGERGTPIVFFSPVEKEPSEPGDPDQKFNGESRRHWFHRFYYVWNRDQLEGVDGVQAPVQVVRGPTNERHGLSDCLFHGTGAEVRYGGNRAYYASEEDYIRLPLPEQFCGLDGFHATRFHELVHWTGHPGRLARKYEGAFGSPDYAREELVAEMGSAFLCDWCGLEAELHHPEYIASWLKVLGGDKSAVIVAASQAQKAFDFLLEMAGMKDVGEDLKKAA